MQWQFPRGHLQTVYQRTCIFGFEDFYKSDATDVVSDTQQKNKEPLNSFDLSGRRISVTSASSVPSVLPKGVYIRDGKKVMVVK